GYTSGAITKLTNNLIKEDYIVRELLENDRRVILITITDRGLDVLEEAQKQGRNMRNELYSVLNTQEVEQLLSIQKKLFERVKYLNTKSR
ncbi:MarR family transcriptional regulator, partial [Staphylococcus simulans]|uniref:MarR family winged helix-turn-helix transcriptional regulator n=1 Tax=Staphylococcus simulans TaxID=1286 RepID=UPI000FF1840E